LKEGVLRINRAHQLCKLPKAEQLEQFVSYSEERTTNRVIRRSISQLREKKAILDVLAVLDILQRQEAGQPGSVTVRVGRHKHTVVLIGEDFSAGLPSQRELKLQ
jgi:RecB family endonuclease NucS